MTNTKITEGYMPFMGHQTYFVDAHEEYCKVLIDWLEEND